MLKQAWANIKNKTLERESWLVWGRGGGATSWLFTIEGDEFKIWNINTPTRRELKQQQRRRQRKRHLKRALALSQTSSLLFYLVQFVQNVGEFFWG